MMAAGHVPVRAGVEQSCAGQPAVAPAEAAVHGNDAAVPGRRIHGLLPMLMLCLQVLPFLLLCYF